MEKELEGAREVAGRLKSNDGATNADVILKLSEMEDTIAAILAKSLTPLLAKVKRVRVCVRVYLTFPCVRACVLLQAH